MRRLGLRPLAMVPFCVHRSLQRELPALSAEEPGKLVEVYGCAQFVRCTLEEWAQGVRGCCAHCRHFLSVRVQGGRGSLHQSR